MSPKPFGLSLSKPFLPSGEGRPFDRLRAIGVSYRYKRI
jgi:hypothetical protein